MESSRNPKYLALAQRFKRQIQEGKLLPGDRLPSFTQMRAEFGATPATVERLYALLERENLIERRHRSGVFVTDKLSQQKLQGTIGFVMLGFANSCLHPYNLLLLQGIQQAASAANVQVLLLDHSDIAANLDKMDGLLIYEHELDKFLRYTKGGKPCVSLLKHHPQMPAVVADDFAGGKIAAEYLLNAGHKRIACIMGTAADDLLHDTLGQLRINGYHAALRAAGITPNPKWVRPILYQPFEDYTARLQGIMQQWLAEDWRQLGCTAILAQNDNAAIGIINALQAANVKVPRDVSVVGFDGAGVDAHFAPRLTTVEVPLQAIGRLGTEKLLDLIHGKRVEKHTVLPISLRVEKSTIAPKVLLAT